MYNWVWREVSPCIYRLESKLAMERVQKSKENWGPRTKPEGAPRIEDHAEESKCTEETEAGGKGGNVEQSGGHQSLRRGCSRQTRGRGEPLLTGWFAGSCREHFVSAPGGRGCLSESG